MNWLPKKLEDGMMWLAEVLNPDRMFTIWSVSFAFFVAFTAWAYIFTGSLFLVGHALVASGACLTAMLMNHTIRKTAVYQEYVKQMARRKSFEDRRKAFEKLSLVSEKSSTTTTSTSTTTTTSIGEEKTS